MLLMEGCMLILFYIPFPNSEIAQEIAEKAITLGYAKCCHIFYPVRSLYIWEENMCHEQEHPILFKVPITMKETFQTWMEDIHPYDTPAIINIPASANASFLEWMAS